MFSKFFITRPVLACVISIIIVIAGLISMSNSSVEEYPKLTPPQIVVTAHYSGADAQTIADTVAAPLENAINGVDNMIYMQSSASSSGEVSINVYFKIGTDPSQAKVDINNRVTPALSLLPQEVQRMGVNVSERSSTMLEVLAFYDPSGAMDIINIHNHVSVNIADELKRVPGVGQAMILGDKDYSMRIWLEPGKLKKFNLTIPEITNAIKEQNSQYAAGKIGQEPTTMGNAFVYTIQASGRLKTTKEFENIIIKADKDGKFLRLKDVAKIELGAANYSVNAKFQGHPMVPIIIFMQSGANAIAVSDGVKNKLEELKKETQDPEADFTPLLNKIKELEAQLQEKDEIARNSQIAYLNLKADFDILQRQTQQKIETADRDAILKVVKDLLPFIENLRKSLLNLSDEAKSSPMGQGLQMMYENLLKSLEKLKVRPIEAIGLAPDAQFHEPVSMQPTEDEHLKGKIIQEFEQGFIYENGDDKLVITPSKVIVGN